MGNLDNEIDGRIDFSEVIKLINGNKFKLKLDIEKIKIKGPSKSSKYEKLIQLYEAKKELIFKLTQKENADIAVYIEKDDVLVDIREKDDWKDYIEFVCDNVEIINEFVTGENRLSGAVKQKNEKGIDSFNLHSFGIFYLTLVKIFASDLLKEIKSITINPNTTGYKIEKKYFDDINYELSKEIFKEKKDLTIQDFTKSFLKSILIISLKKKYNLVQINPIEIKSIDIKDIKMPKNILLKGVPGTGKSRTINNIINRYIADKVENVEIDQILRINIHSASTNADLMQGIGVLMDKNNIIYKEKRGSILKHIVNAILYPNIPFFLVLEEVQENSLNELIGDLIFLIEDEKRVDINEKNYSKESMDIWAQIEYICKNNEDINYVTIPNLIEANELIEKKIIIPNNLYVLCTTNYREDKKIIEDNLFRRFEVIDVFPDDKVIKNDLVKDFFYKVNKQIIDKIEDDDNKDRYLIGHSNWINVDTEEKFYRAFLKLINEFKEIRQIEFQVFKSIILGVNTNESKGEINSAIKEILKTVKSEECKTYYNIIQKIYKYIHYNDLENAWK